MNANSQKKAIIADLRVELADEFDRNFQRKAFFSERWLPRRDKKARGSLLIVSGALRRSIEAHETATGVRFTSQVPYATVHNEGGTGYVTVREHQRRHHATKKAYRVATYQRRQSVPQRQFVGNSPEVRAIVRSVCEQNLEDYAKQLTQYLRRK